MALDDHVLNTHRYNAATDAGSNSTWLRARVAERCTMPPVPVPLRVARLAALIATLGVLVATSAPVCGKRTAPVVFRAQGTCGPDGLVVVTAGEFTIGFSNAAVLGLPPRTSGVSTASRCPIIVEHGGWEVRVPSCTGDAGATAGCPRTCTVAQVSNGPLQFECVDATGLPLCASSLTLEE